MSYASLEKTLKKTYTDLSKLVIDPNRHLRVLPSGILSLDRALQRGGIIAGLITELFGDSEAGKTTLAAHFAANCQKLWHQDVLFLDYERTLDTEYYAKMGVEVKHPGTIAEEMGLNPEVGQVWDPAHPEAYRPGLIILEPATIEEGMSMIVNFMMNGPVGIVIIDTIAGMSPASEVGDGAKKDVAMRADEIESNAGRTKVEQVTKTSMGALSREVAAVFRHMTKLLVDKQVSFLAINQLRNNIGFITTKTTPGGYAMHHYANTRIELRRTGLQKPKDSAPGAHSFGESVSLKAVGADVDATVVKNKRGIPFAIAHLSLTFGEGFDVSQDIFDALTIGGLADRQERTYTFIHEDFSISFDTVHQLRVLLKGDIDSLDLQRRIKIKMGVGQDIRVGLLQPAFEAGRAPAEIRVPSRRRSSREVREGGAPMAPVVLPPSSILSAPVMPIKVNQEE